MSDTIAATPNKPATRRQRLAAAEYLYGDSRRRLTHREIAEKFGVSPSAITRRLISFRKTLTPEQLCRFKAATRRGRKKRVVAMQLNEMNNV